MSVKACLFLVSFDQRKEQKFPLNDEPTGEEKKKLKFLSLFNSLSFEEDEEEETKRTKRDGVVPVARVHLSVTLSLSLSVFDIERERENSARRDERGKKRIKFPPTPFGKKELIKGKEISTEKKRITEDAHLNGSCSVGVMTKPFSEDILFAFVFDLSLPPSFSL